MSRRREPLPAYDRARAVLPQVLAPQLTGNVTEAYWIDDHRLFYTVSQRVDGGAILLRPMIANAQSGSSASAIAFDDLLELLSNQPGKMLALSDLAGATYDMPGGDRLVATISGVAYHIALDRHALIAIESLDPLPALYSPDGRNAAFLKDHTVWLRDRATGIETCLFPDGEPLYQFGHPIEAGAAPLAARRHPVPQGLWSADSAWFVTHRIDERHLPDGELVEHAPANGGRPIVHRYKVSLAGDPLPRVEFIAVHVATGRIVSAADEPTIPQAFSPFQFRDCWFAGGCFYYLTHDRFCATIGLIELDLQTGTLRRVIEEKAGSGWLDTSASLGSQPLIRVLPASSELIWYSEADGYGHLYLHDLRSGACKNRITQGAWMVREIVQVDEQARRILYLANGTEGARDPSLRRLYAIDFDGTQNTMVLACDNDIGIRPDVVAGVEQTRPHRPSYASSGLSPDGSHVATSLGAANVPTRTVITDIETQRDLPLAESNINDFWHGPKPLTFEVLASDGVTKLYGALYLPSDFDASRSYPLVDYIYPGPQTNWFQRRFPTADALLLQSLAELGMVGVIVESRGLPLRGRAFHQAGRGSLHEPQLGDHAAVMLQLCERYQFIDRNRIGIFGQSGGGHSAARALFDYPEVFKTGVSICGNHDCRNYISFWIDKYGGRPGTPARDAQSNLDAAARLQGALLLIHGDMDDNVHVGQTLALSARLSEAGKRFRQLIIPGAGHGVIFESAAAITAIWDFFAEHLLDAEPPKDFALAFDLTEAGAGLHRMISGNY
ncbi:dienelactone hydrolase [Sphingopyxis panaciterrae]|uniref:S9 family peptidase n=1 Tax=Sphingopyxis panaciterrae TaxID=363841 RepID=UPI00141FF815|nr:prolyl oligopeptidase family serine peptidase [Sphingopyxis panaciterrae]NIJ37793.1 dienelactone hydrolase [Sphingopyxis panaciterrae]